MNEVQNGTGLDRRRPARIPFEAAAQRLNRDAGLYLSERQQQGLAAALFAGAVIVAAGMAWSVGRAFRRHLR